MKLETSSLLCSWVARSGFAAAWKPTMRPSQGGAPGLRAPTASRDGGLAQLAGSAYAPLTPPVFQFGK